MVISHFRGARNHYDCAFGTGSKSAVLCFYLFYWLCYNSAMRNDLLTSIKSVFKQNELFSSADINDKNMSEAAKKEGLVRLVKSGDLKRYSYGFYYIPGHGEPSVSEAIELRYISRGKDIYGFYTGECFLMSINNRKISVNEKVEIMTNKATSGKKNVYMFGKRFTLRKPYYPIDKNNVTLNAFLAYIAMTPLSRIKENYSVLADYIKKAHLAANDVMEMAVYYPAKTASKLLASDLYRSLWKH